MSSEMNNESSEYYENASSFDQNNKQRDCLLQAFLKMNKNENSSLRKEEVNDFFEEEGIKFPNLVSKLIAGIFQNEEVLTVNQFISSFISLQKELKMTHDNTLSKVQQKKLAIARYEKKLNESKNETLDANGLCPNANVKIDVLECNMTKVGFDECQIQIRMNEEEYNTPSFSSTMKNMAAESCVFKPKTKDDALKFKLYGKNSNSPSDFVKLGSITFSLNEMSKQEEFEVDLTIPDDKEEIVGEIKIKILFIYSYYEYYEELCKEEKKGLESIEKSVQKSKGYLEQIQQMKAIKQMATLQNNNSNTNNNNTLPQSRQNQNYNQQIKQPSTLVESDANMNINVNNNIKKNEVIKQELKEDINIQDKGVSLITKEELSYKSLSIYLLYSWIGVCLINFLVRPEYVGVVIGFISYLNVRYNLLLIYTTQLLIGIGGSIALDLLWMFVSMKGVWLGGVLGKITSILVPIEMLVKGGVLFKIITSKKQP